MSVEIIDERKPTAKKTILAESIPTGTYFYAEVFGSYSLWIKGFDCVLKADGKAWDSRKTIQVLRYQPVRVKITVVENIDE